MDEPVTQNAKGLARCARRGSRGLAMLAVASLTLVARSATAANLYLVWDGASYNACHGAIEDMFACTLGATNYNDVLAGYRGGERVTVAASIQIPVQCRDSTGQVPQCLPAGASGAAHMFACVESMLHLDLHTGDIIMYFTSGGACAGGEGCNIQNMALSAPSGTVTVRGGWSDVGTSCRCLEPIGLHEVMEAASVTYADDCCNGQTYYRFDGSCSAMFGPTSSTPYGVTSVRCGTGTYREQGITAGPRSNGLYYGADCHPAMVTATPGSPEEVCTLARADRIAGRCIGNQLVTCELSLQTQVCDAGCVSTPTPHCLAFDAACTVDSPTSACSGAPVPVAVTCANTGGVPYDARLSLVADTSGAAALFADATWLSPTTAASVTPATVPPGSIGSFPFVLRAPEVLAPVAYTLTFGFEELGGLTYVSPHVSFDLTVTPCAPSPSLDGGMFGSDASMADGDADGGNAVGEAPGCGCRTAGTPGALPCGVLPVLVAGAWSRRRRRWTA